MLETCLSESIGARKIYSTAYHHQRNSICDSFMRTLNKALGALFREDGSNWDVHLQDVAFAHNSMLHTSTNYSPFFLYRDTWTRQGSMFRRGDGLTGCGARACTFTRGIWPRRGVVKHY